MVTPKEQGPAKNTWRGDLRKVEVENTSWDKWDSKLTREARVLLDRVEVLGVSGGLILKTCLPCVMVSSSSVTKVDTQGKCVFEFKLGWVFASMCEKTLGLLASFCFQLRPE